ncbi:MAG: IS110 family transposase [Rivularia sp. (in: Bacteria)]|nr:IS110 family transposase [Rivularia sp. MS3]MBV6643193.1 IS110 family transposase [Cyclobacteriaceae bacterium SS2]MBV6643289.1 IS110 family transposase [Cyclobacteriaceae bacterium SS2]
MEKKVTSFASLTLYIGIDVHKKQWSVSVYSGQIHHRTFSQPPNPEALKAYLDKYFPMAKVVCAYEATRFGFWIARKLQSYGYDCLVVNPADIPTTHQENQNKTDPVDSRKIARTLQSGLLTGSHIPSEITEGDRQLFRYRKRLWSDLIRVKNRIKGTLMFSGIELPAQYDNAYWSKAFLRWLTEVELPSASGKDTMNLLLIQYHLIYRHFLDTSIKVRKLLRSTRYKDQGRLLRTIPGIGPLTSVQILTELEDVKRFSSFKKLNSFVGLKPTTHSSGEHDRKGHLTIRRHKALRSALVECAWQTVQNDPAMLVKYEELIQRMTKKRAVVVIAKKLLSRIYYVLKNNQPYELGIVK